MKEYAFTRDYYSEQLKGICADIESYIECSNVTYDDIDQAIAEHEESVSRTPKDFAPEPDDIDGRMHKIFHLYEVEEMAVTGDPIYSMLITDSQLVAGRVKSEIPNVKVVFV